MSPNVSQTTQERAVAELGLAPAVKEHLDALLATYGELSFDIDLLSHQRDIERLAIGNILEEAGVDKAKAADFSLCWVRGATTSKLDKTKLLAQGVTMAQIEAATTTKPKKVYFMIRGKNEVTRPTDE